MMLKRRANRLRSFTRMLAALVCLASALIISPAASQASSSDSLPMNVQTAAEGESPDAGVNVIEAPSGPEVTTTSSHWGDVPHMTGAIVLANTGDVAMTFCAEVRVAGDQRLFVRALMDQGPSSPGDVVLAVGATLDTRCFTFVQNGVLSGKHIVRIQWMVDSGGTGFAGDRTLRVTFARPGAAELRLLAVAAPSGPDQTLSGGWADIPDMSGSIQLASESNVTINLSAEADTTGNKALFVRALVDGQLSTLIPDDQVLTVEGFSGVRTVTFVRQQLAAGTHTIQLQWLVESGGEGHLGDRTLTAVGVPTAGSRSAGQLMVSAAGTPSNSSLTASWANIPDLGGTIALPAAGDLAMSFSAEIRATGGKRVFVRALVDGQPIRPSDVRLFSGGWRGAYAFTFVRQNMSRGNHAIQLQWRIDEGGSGFVAGRTLAAYAFARPYQTTWTPLPNIDTYTGPALASDLDGRLYAVAVAFSAHVYFSSTDAPGRWTAWQSIGPEHDCLGAICIDPAFHADPHTAPVLVHDGSTLYLFARGTDDNLYKTYRTAVGWASWQPLTTDASVHGRISVALTRPRGVPSVHVLYTSTNNTVTYRLFDGLTWNQIPGATQWGNALDGTLGTDGTNEVWAAIRTTERRLLIEKKNQPWTSDWQAVTSRLADGPDGAFLDVSNIAFFAGAYHVAYSMKYLCDDVSGSYCYVLAHARFRPRLLDDGYLRIITDYAPSGNPPQATLNVYRNKLVMAYSDDQGQVRYSYWDNADPATPWVGGDVVDSGARTAHRPALAVLNRRTSGLAAQDYLEANFGNDLFAAISDTSTDSAWFINFSRALFTKRLAQIGLAVKWCMDYPGSIAACPAIDDHPAISELPVYTEVGFGTIVLPDWLMSRILVRGMAAIGQAGVEYNTWIHTQYITPYIGPNLNIDYQADTMSWMEEMGHRLAGWLGIYDFGERPDPNVMSDFIPETAITQALDLFGELLNPDCFPNTTDDNCPEDRVPGFTGHGHNYDVATRQHSWIYVLYYYLNDGTRLRQWAQDDLQNNQPLLQQKYDWIKQYLFRGVEFKPEVEPLAP